MYRNDRFRPSVVLDLPNGIYVFANASSVGKTRLFVALREVQVVDGDVLTYTQMDSRLGLRLKDVLAENPGRKVLMLDRYDMYLGVCKKKIVEYAKDAIVLVDCKSSDFWFTEEDKRCFLKMTPDLIEVTL